jgi:hypothetical protein
VSPGPAEQIRVVLPTAVRATADPEAALRAWLRARAKGHPRRGYRNAHPDAVGEGWHVNLKKIQRLWREEVLRVIVRRRHKRVGSSTAEPIQASSPDTVWAVDSQYDASENGRPVKITSIVDEHTRECLGGLVERSITADRLVDLLDHIVAVRGVPRVLRYDNGPEFASRVLANWAEDRIGPAYNLPGKLWQNG